MAHTAAQAFGTGFFDGFGFAGLFGRLSRSEEGATVVPVKDDLLDKLRADLSVLTETQRDETLDAVSSALRLVREGRTMSRIGLELPTGRFVVELKSGDNATEIIIEAFMGPKGQFGRAYHERRAEATKAHGR